MNVQIYTTPACSQCETTKKVLDRGGVEYEVIDLSTNPDAHDKVMKLGYTQAPVVVAGDQTWSGFRHGKLTNLIAQIHGEEASKPNKESVAA